jgi:hypothetical protein
MKNILVISILATALISNDCKRSDPFPLTDLHIHLKGNFTIQDAVKKSADENIRYGIVINCGFKFPVHKDSQIDSVLQTLKDYPQFYKGMQAEGREWVNLFSKESIDKFDYVFTDAMTFTDAKGRRNRIWMPAETWVDDEEGFMNYLVNIVEKIMREEPIDIYVNPTFLPAQMQARYDYFWTAERMDRVINAARANNIAIEINNRYRIPSFQFIERAKAAGIKFTIGTNNPDEHFSGADYARQIIRKCGLTENDFFVPFKK